MVVSLALQSHVAWIASGGCTPVVLPMLPGVEQLVNGLDGLLLPGGPDVDPSLYGESLHPQTRVPDPAVDRVELMLLEAAVESGVPLLAICRGMQLLNVSRGGSLHQHLPDLDGRDRHRPSSSSEAFAHHRLRLHPGSRISRVLGGDSSESACHHHQAVNELGAGLVATGWAEDGTVEVVELLDHPFAVGVQWEAGQSQDDRLHLALAHAATQRAEATRATWSAPSLSPSS